MVRGHYVVAMVGAVAALACDHADLIRRTHDLSADGAVATMDAGADAGTRDGATSYPVQVWEAGMFADVGQASEAGYAENLPEGASVDVASCNDGIKNGDESDIDCGGTCIACGNLSACVVGGDCASGVCSSDLCQEPACSDDVKNGSETDIDCGGSCDPCPAISQCQAPTDCASGVCTNGTCQASTCSDGVMNGFEIDVDCGGSCGACGGAHCGDGSNCASGVCTDHVCVAPTCSDGVQNGTEVDVDCGGSCLSCPGVMCSSDSECASGICLPDCVDSYCWAYCRAP